MYVYIYIYIYIYIYRWKWWRPHCDVTGMVVRRDKYHKITLLMMTYRFHPCKYIHIYMWNLNVGPKWPSSSWYWTQKWGNTLSGCGVNSAPNWRLELCSFIFNHPMPSNFNSRYVQHETNSCRYHFRTSPRIVRWSSKYQVGHLGCAIAWLIALKVRARKNGRSPKSI